MSMEPMRLSIDRESWASFGGSRAVAVGGTKVRASSSAFGGGGGSPGASGEGLAGGTVGAGDGLGVSGCLGGAGAAGLPGGPAGTGGADVSCTKTCGAGWAGCAAAP
jgi:hypothetical protein